MVNLGFKEGLDSLAFVFQSSAGKLFYPRGPPLNLCTQHFEAALCFWTCAFFGLLIYDYKEFLLLQF